MSAEPPAPVALDLLRRQVAALLSQIDTATLPRPDKVHGKREEHPGCEWNPQKGWRIRTVEDADSAGFVYVDHDCNDITYRWGVPGDWECLRIEDARQIGLAFLAAAHRAEELFAGVSRLDVADADDAPELDEVASVSPMQSRRHRGR
ncbi:hypothetical protein [Plantactinospora sp. WMMB782]|uniref:hypothetical protein n=1 Tax=Plantactinospora sp. WMMB782 TaxID=3404121 RepID=UPI003B94242B